MTPERKSFRFSFFHLYRVVGWGCGSNTLRQAGGEGREQGGFDACEIRTSCEAN